MPNKEAEKTRCIIGTNKTKISGVTTKKMLPITIITFIFIAFYLGYEGVRWQFTSKACYKKHEEYLNLLNSENCRHLVLHGEEMQQLCKKAHIEVSDVNHFQCTLRDFWKESGIYDVYKIFLLNYWLLFGVTVLPICYVIYKSFDACRQKREEEMYKKILEKIPAAPVAGKGIVVTTPLKTLGSSVGDHVVDNPFEINFKKRKLGKIK
jgi:hypothetical protein